ncbi:hypothetical protein X975_27040, partial [Stegodyphus mimosarum]
MMVKMKTSLQTYFFILTCLMGAIQSLDQQKKDGKTLTDHESETDMVAAPSIAVANYKVQSVASRSSAPPAGRRYGYPYLIAPTLPPFLKRSDDYENEADHTPAAASERSRSPAKPYGTRLSSSDDDNDDDVPRKKNSHKKHKIPYTYGATRRQSYDEEAESSAEKGYRSYREPKYRNFDELESMFMPRRMDIGGRYSQYDYSPRDSNTPLVSPRDPYLSPTDEPTDSFYPVPKVKSYSSTYRQSGRIIPSYGAGKYDDPDNYHNDHIHGGYAGDSYIGPTSKYPSNGGHYGYEEDYAIESNKPIMGDIRKRLLDYAGASDLYEGEPDYLREVAQNKNKYGSIGNDYYAYGGPEYRSSYRNFPYVESKIMIVKKSRTL